ncbi:MAG: REP-associated tyrosine transposase [Thermosediminibacterales bacterium]|nr:REP-associated tyrosine transposase [Thermosediminibacterales bacterium]MDK2836661.1 REP-associated tyrosine transposase [Thermosediminibacterales bacterium]
MPRRPRIKSENAIYHIIQRGNEKQIIFREEEDKTRFLNTLKLKKHKYGFEVYCYCLMDNHIHLLVGSEGADVSEFMKSISVSYVMYFNKKYERIGHLFQGRFKSEIVDTDKYFLQASKYIHKNPVKAGIVDLPEKYKWSSYGIYLGVARDEFRLIDREFLLEIISEDKKVAVEEYKKFVEFEDITDESYKRFIKFEEIQDEIKNINCELIEEITRKYSLKKDQMIVELRKNTNLSLREISKLAGISASTAHRILKNNKNKA